MIIKFVIGYIVFTIVGIIWFLNRMGDKHGSDKRWFIKPLDAILITPLFPYAILLGAYDKFTRRKK